MLLTEPPIRAVRYVVMPPMNPVMGTVTDLAGMITVTAGKGIMPETGKAGSTLQKSIRVQLTTIAVRKKMTGVA
jgi:hypothetical protein